MYIEQDRWAYEFLKLLRATDDSDENGHHIFTLCKYTPQRGLSAHEDRLLVTSDVLDINAAIEGEAGADGGNTAVSGMSLTPND